MMSSPTSNKIHVIQGEHHVATGPDTMLTTVLGSCVAACIRDPVAGVGGMNHFLLGEQTGPETDQEAQRYGAYAMELLINGLIAKGAKRNRLEAKLFGGARMFEGLSDVGASNAVFAKKFLANEGIPVTGESLGGTCARRIEFWPESGRVRQRLVVQQDLPDTVRQPRPRPAPAGDVELF